MSYHITYRPDSFEDFIGNRDLVESLQGVISGKNPSHAYLFQGNSGCGKTTLGRIIARALGASDETIIEINAADKRGIETARAIIDECRVPHIMGNKKVYIIDEVQQTTNDFQSALLKIIEDCPKHAYFIFCTTHPEKILPTVKSRCLIYEVKPLNFQDAEQLLLNVCEAEKLDQVTEELAHLLIQHSEGRPRRLLTNLFKCKDLTYDHAKALLEGSVEGVLEDSIEICKMLMKPEKVRWEMLMSKVEKLVAMDSAESVRMQFFAWYAKCLRGAKDSKDIILYTSIMEVLDVRIIDNGQGLNGLVFLLGKIYKGLALGV